MIKPLGSNILLKKVLKRTTSKGGIILSTKEEEQQNIGEVIAVGSEVKEIKPGMKIIFEQYKENKFTEGEDEMMIIEAKNALAIIIDK